MSFDGSSRQFICLPSGCCSRRAVTGADRRDKRRGKRRGSFILSLIRLRSGATRRTGRPATAPPSPISPWRQAIFCRAEGALRALLLLGTELRLRRPILHGDPRWPLRQLPMFQHSLRGVLRRYQRHPELPGISRYYSKCGTDGSLCGTINAAPVCQAVNQGALIPGSNIYSTIQLRLRPHERNWPNQLLACAIRRMHDRALFHD